VVNELPAGVITALPRPGQVITRGKALYRQANQPVTLFYGGTPAWRDIGPEATPGPDIRELDENLDALGYDAGALGDTMTWRTVAAIERWQLAHGMTQTGTIQLGQICFLPGPVRVTATAASPGTPAAPGTQVLTGTSATPSVTVNLQPGGAPARPGDHVLVTLPDGTTTVPGHVRTVGAVTRTSPSQNQSTPTAIIPVTISLDGYRLPGDLDQAPVQVIMTEQTDPNVLAVPVTALLAQPGGGYAVRTSPSGQLISVTARIYDDTTGLIEVSGAGLTAGTTVQAAQG
jgi:Putative peptidoglycan binding domain